MKFIAVRRLWRPLPYVREDACSKLEDGYGLLLSKDNNNNNKEEEGYIAMSVRRGDKKSVERYEFQDLSSYLVQADRDIRDHFGGKAPKIFVATDDCSVMREFRNHRPNYTFYSECDDHDNDNNNNNNNDLMHAKQSGFALRDVDER